MRHSKNFLGLACFFTIAIIFPILLTLLAESLKPGSEKFSVAGIVIAISEKERSITVKVPGSTAMITIFDIDNFEIYEEILVLFVKEASSAEILFEKLSYPATRKKETRIIWISRG